MVSRAVHRPAIRATVAALQVSGVVQGVAPPLPPEVNVASRTGGDLGTLFKKRNIARAVLPFRALNKYGSCSSLTGAAKLLSNTSLHRAAQLTRLKLDVWYKL